MLKLIHEKWTAFLKKHTYPDDPDERRRIKAYILGGGAGACLRPDASGRIRIEIEDEKDGVKG